MEPFQSKRNNMWSPPSCGSVATETERDSKLCPSFTQQILLRSYQVPGPYQGLGSEDTAMTKTSRSPPVCSRPTPRGPRAQFENQRPQLIVLNHCLNNTELLTKNFLWFLFDTVITKCHTLPRSALWNLDPSHSLDSICSRSTLYLLYILLIVSH